MPATLTREDNKIYIDASSTRYAVFTGRESRPRSLYEINFVRGPENPNRSIWLVLKTEDGFATQLEDYSSYSNVDAMNYAHNLAIDKASGILQVNQTSLNPPASSPLKTTPRIKLTEILDNSPDGEKTPGFITQMPHVQFCL